MLMFLRPFLPYVAVALACVALWFAYERWSAALVERGVMQERKTWQALNLAQSMKNEQERAIRAEGALEESRSNAITSERLGEVFRKLTHDQAARMQILRDQLALSEAALFEPPHEADCRVYVRPAFIEAANGISQ